LSFQNSKCFPLNFLISIFVLLSIYSHHKNWYQNTPTVKRIITNLSQNLSHKGVPLKSIIYLMPTMIFKPFSLMQCTHSFLTHKRK
jgi:hypothetical protein